MKSNIHAYRQREHDFKKALRAMLDVAKADGNRAFNETEAAQYEDTLKALKANTEMLEREEHMLELERSSKSITDPNTDAADRADTPSNKPEAKKFASFGEQLQAVMAAERSGGRRFDPRLISAGPSGINEAVPSDGGIVVQPDFQSDIEKRMYSLGEILSRVNRKEVSGNGLKLNAVDESSRATGSRWGGVQVYWMNEADALTASKPKFRPMSLSLNKLGAVYYATEEVLADAPALGAIAAEAFSEEMMFTVEDAIWEGDGSGKPQGFMNSGALVTVSKESSQASTTLVSENVLKMFSRMWPRSRANAVWFVNQDVMPQLPQLNIKIKNVAASENVGGISTPIYQFPTSTDDYGRILGRPVIPVEYASTLGTLGDIVLADLSQYLLISKGGIQSASSMHVRFLNDEMAFRLTQRLDGQFIWNKALTPFKGSNTLSPIVTLQAR